MLLNESDLNAKFTEVITYFRQELNKFRTGRLNIDPVKEVKVEQYGQMTQVGYIANVYVDGTSIVVKPFNPQDLKEIEKAISATEEIGGTINAQESGILRINFPPLTLDTRKQIAKGISPKLEEFRVRVRRIRHDAKKELEEMAVELKLPEDEVKRDEEKLQQMVDKCIKELEDMAEKKEEEIMTI